MRPTPTKRAFALLAILCCLSAFAANANLLTCGVNLGAAGPYGYGIHTRGWAAFTLGDMIDKDDMSGSSMINGDVGVGGNGNLNMSGSATIFGDVWQHTGGTYTTYSPGAIHGSRFQDAAHDSVLNQGAIDALNADTQAWNLPVSPAYAGLTNIQTGSNYTLTATDDCTVLKLQNFKISGGATFTLSGTATQHFIINVSNTFSLTGGAKIVLSGGVTFDNVLFNVHSSGADVSISSSSTFNGILLAAQRKVALSGSEVANGEIIANKLTLSGSSKINLPPVVSN
jgi:hypothetical protein